MITNNDKITINFLKNLYQEKKKEISTGSNSQIKPYFGIIGIYNNYAGISFLIADELFDLTENYISEELIEKTQKIIKILEFEIKNGRLPSKTEMIRDFSLYIDEIDEYLILINEIPFESFSDDQDIKNKATNTIRLLETLTLYDILKTMNFDINVAKKVGKYLIDNKLIEDLLRIPKKEEISNGKMVASKIKIFLSYATSDKEFFKVPTLVKILEQHKEIEKVFYWERDSGQNIIQFMNDNLEKCKIFILICSENSLDSKNVESEWQAAFQLKQEGRLKIIPIYDNLTSIPALLKPFLGVSFNTDNFDGFMEALHTEILRE